MELLGPRRVLMGGDQRSWRLAICAPGLRPGAIGCLLAAAMVTNMLVGCGDDRNGAPDHQRSTAAAQVRAMSNEAALMRDVSDVRRRRWWANSGPGTPPPRIFPDPSTTIRPGTYRGVATLRRTKGTDSVFPLTMRFAKDTKEKDASIVYPTLRCAAFLVPTDMRGRSVSYFEATVVGGCPVGGTWTVSIAGDDDIAAEWVGDYNRMSARLKRSTAITAGASEVPPR